MAGGLKDPAGRIAAVALVQTESRLGLKDAAREHAAEYLGVLARLAANPQDDPVTPVLEAAFPKRGADAKVWWTFLRQKFPQDAAAGTMKVSA